jgi:acetylornithine deacetylase
MAESSACVRYLREYIAIPSVNPMGRSDCDPAIVGERRYAEHLHAQLRRIGIDARLIGDPDRPTVVAEARPARATETVLIASHLDTVPVEGMEIPPFEPWIEDGKLYGRGSCDTKGSMAALIDALEQVLRAGTLRRNVIIAGEADEEAGSLGARALLEHLEERMPDWAIATEPTELRVVHAHKGIVHARIAARGIAGHSSRPEAGRNAVVDISRAVLSLDRLATRLVRRTDPELGPPTLSVGVVEGGAAANIIPDYAWLMLDRRLIPGETGDSVRAEIEEALRESGAEDLAIERCRLEKGPLATPLDHRSVQACQSALEAVGLPTEPATAGFGTDAGVFQEAGLVGVVIGPGSVAQAHTAREWVELAQVEAMVDVFRRILEAES